MFLVDFSVYKPAIIHKRSGDYLMQQAKRTGRFNDQSMAFMRKMLERSGIGPQTYFPFNVINVPCVPTMADAWGEAKDVSPDIPSRTSVMLPVPFIL